MFIDDTGRDGEDLDTRAESAGVAANKGRLETQLFASPRQRLAIERQQRLVLVHGIACAMGIERDRRATAELPGGLFKRLPNLLHVALARLRRLKTAQLPLDMDARGHRIARAPGGDTPKQDACLIIIQRAMRIASSAENLQGIDGLGQVFARMTCASLDFNIEGDIGRAPRNHDASLESVIEHNTLAHS